jgi:hypothetical protein
MIVCVGVQICMGAQVHTTRVALVPDRWREKKKINYHNPSPTQPDTPNSHSAGGLVRDNVGWRFCVVKCKVDGRRCKIDDVS